MVERLVEAALATPGVKAPREALSAAFAYAAEPVEDLTFTVDGREQLHPDRLTPVRGVKALTLSIRLLGCAGSTWERNERNATRWVSPADPTASKSRWTLPPVRNWTGPDGEPTAALSIMMESADRVTDVIRRAARLLTEGDGRRGQDLTADLLQNGQEEPCLMVAQVYRTPGADFWAWPTVKGNNRTNSRHQILNTDQAALLTASDITAVLHEWTDKRNAELSNAGADGHLARQALQVAAVDAQLVLGCDEPALLYSAVQSGNRRDHIHALLAFETAEQNRAVGRRVLESYHAAGIINTATLDVLAGELPVTQLPQCPPGAGICEQRELRRTLLLAEFFPTPKDRRSRLIRQRMAEPPDGKLEEQHVTQRLRVYSALCSASWPQAWNPRVDDATVGLPQARAGIIVRGGTITHLLAAADADDEAFAELVHYTAPQWLAAFRLADADRGSMGAQASRGTDAGTGNRIRRTMPDVLNALSARRKQAVALLREMADAMESERLPPGAHHQRRPQPKVLRVQTRHHLAERRQRPGRGHRADGCARHPARLPAHPGRPAEPRRRGEAGDGRHRQRLLLRHGVRPVQDPGLQLLPALSRPGRPAVLESRDGRRRDRPVRSSGGPGEEQGEPEQGDPALGGHAPGRGLAGHQSGPRL